MPGDINHLPVLDAEMCNGCGACILFCPGLAIFVVDKTWSGERAIVKIPFENVPVPQAGQYAAGLDRAGRELGWFEIVKVASGGKTNLTKIISLAVPQDLAMEVRNIRAGGYRADGCRTGGDNTGGDNTEEDNIREDKTGGDRTGGNSDEK